MKLLTNLLFEPKGKHDPALAYNIKDTVMSADGSKVYFALQDVPAGTALSNGDYWKLQIDLSSSKSAMDQALASFGNYAKEIGTRVKGETAKASGNPVTFLPDAGSLLQPVTVLELQQAGSGEPSPENIRPIVGWDKLNLTASGKNLLNNVRYYDNTHTDIRAQYDNPLLLKAGVTYTLSTNFQADGLFFVDATGNGSLEAQYLLNYQYQVASLSYTPTRDIECIFVAIFNSGVPNGATIQLEVGSATAYEPYQGNNYTVQIGQTVYGGKFDWLTGKFVVTDELRTYNGSEGWFSNSGGNDSLFYIVPDAAFNSVSASSHTPVVNEIVPQSIIGSGYYTEYGVLYMNLMGTQRISIEEFMAKLAASPVQIAYKLANPIEIQLTPHIITAADPEQVNTLCGDGSIEAEYVKPLHVSIEERVAAAMNTEGE